ncbi:MAG: 2-hydroxyacyl-CoA dehydratase family protein, partial [Pseudomonadota bacterium]
LATAEPLTHTTLHEAVESAGGRIVAEDDWWGARAPGGDVSLDLPPMEALLAKYCLDTATADSYPVEDRLAWFEQAAQRSDVDGVIFYIPPSDLRYGWDYPRLRASLQEQEKPFLLIREDTNTSTGRAHLAEQAANFIRQVRGDKPGPAP